MDVTKAESQALRITLSQAKSYLAIQEIMGSSSGQEEFRQFLEALGSNPPREHRMILDRPSIDDSDGEIKIITPVGAQNPEPPGSGAPFLPNDMDRTILSRIPGHDATTPTPTGAFLART